jgi:hypothetical protein
MCIAGKQTPLKLSSTKAASGVDAKFGEWTGTTASFGFVEYTFKAFANHPNVAVATATFPADVDTSGCGSNSDLTTHFPAWSTTAARGADLHTLSWRGDVMSTTAAAKGLDALGANGLDCGPVASTDPENGNTLVWSTLDSHKIVPQMTANGQSLPVSPTTLPLPKLADTAGDRLSARLRASRQYPAVSSRCSSSPPMCMC